MQYYVEHYFELFEFPQNVTVAFHDVVARIYVNNRKLKLLLEDYFKEFLSEEPTSSVDIYAAESDNTEMVDELEFVAKNPDPGKKKIKEEYVDCKHGRIVRKRLTGMVFMFGGSNNLAMGPCIANVNQVINFVNNRFIEIMLNRKSLLLHASGVSVEGNGLAIAGFSGAGKSTLALHMMQEGVDFVSNDRILIAREHDQLLMHGVAKYPRINPGTIISIGTIENILSEEEKKTYKSMRIQDLWDLEHKYDLYIDEVFGKDRFHLTARMNVLVVLNWKRGGEKTVIEEIDCSKRHDLYPAFMKSPGLFYVAKDGKVPSVAEEEYETYLEGCRVFEVTGGIDFQMAADYFIRVLQ